MVPYLFFLYDLHITAIIFNQHHTFLQYLSMRNSNTEKLKKMYNKLIYTNTLIKKLTFYNCLVNHIYLLISCFSNQTLFFDAFKSSSRPVQQPLSSSACGLLHIPLMLLTDKSGLAGTDDAVRETVSSH